MLSVLYANDTEGGGYFVANYPPFASWTREAVAPEPPSLDAQPEEQY